jgi:hypothetical protein
MGPNRFSIVSPILTVPIFPETSKSIGTMAGSFTAAGQRPRIVVYPNIWGRQLHPDDRHALLRPLGLQLHADPEAPLISASDWLRDA